MRNLLNLFIVLNVLTISIPTLQAAEEMQSACACSECKEDKIDKAINKLSKKKKKILNKIKETLNPEKQQELTNTILESDLTESQKAGLIEALNQSKEALENIKSE